MVSFYAFETRRQKVNIYVSLDICPTKECLMVKRINPVKIEHQGEVRLFFINGIEISFYLRHLAVAILLLHSTSHFLVPA